MIKKIFLLVTLLTFLTSISFAAKKSEEFSYTYTSQEYHYSIECPKKPNVVPASVFLDDKSKKGEILIFENVEYNVVRGWLILVDAFNPNAVPDFNKSSKSIIEPYVKEIQKQGYEDAKVIELMKGNKGLFAITSKEIKIDEDGDGIIDGVATTDRQDAITFFRTSDGSCFSVQLVGSAGINDIAINNFMKALYTFKIQY